jgi:hypothetical protein
MWKAKIWWEGIAPGGNIRVFDDEIQLIAGDRCEASKVCNRITRNGMRIGEWFIPHARIISIHLKEVKNE